MIGLILIYFIGKAFYDLAAKHQRNKWGFAVIGVVSYYFGLLLGGVVVGIAVEVISPGTIDDYSETALGAMAIPLGLAACWGLYKILERQWSKPSPASGDDVLDSDLMK